MAFLENHGKNIQLSNQNLTAARVSSYNQGLLVTAQPLARQQLFQVRVRLNVIIDRFDFGGTVLNHRCFCPPVSHRPSEPVMDVVAVFRGDWSLPRPAQLPLHGVLSEALSLAPAARLCLPQLPEGVH